METYISNWTAEPQTLRIRVSTKPLMMGKEYVWAHHTTNHYGQGAKWCWWNLYEGKPSEMAYGDEAQEMLNQLVRQHSVLSLIIRHYNIPAAAE